MAAVSPATAAPQDWSGDLLVLAVPEEAFDATGAICSCRPNEWGLLLEMACVACGESTIDISASAPHHALQRAVPAAQRRSRAAVALPSMLGSLPRVTHTLHAGSGDSPSIKDAELKALDAALGGIVTEFVQIHEFAGKAVRASFPGSQGLTPVQLQHCLLRPDSRADGWSGGEEGCMHIWRRAALRHAQPAQPAGMSARPAAGPPSSP